jgi:hypothetical protein
MHNGSCGERSARRLGTDYDSEGAEKTYGDGPHDGQPTEESDERVAEFETPTENIPARETPRAGAIDIPRRKMANTPSRLWSTSQEGKLEQTMAHANLSAITEKSSKALVHKQLHGKNSDKFERMAGMEANKASNAWLWACPKEHNKLNVRRFSVAAHT